VYGPEHPGPAGAYRAQADALARKLGTEGASYQGE
jgi:hypothetical protein